LEPAADLLGGPALLEAVEDLLAQVRIAFQAGAFPAPGSGLLLGIDGSIADLAAGVSVQLSRNRRWRAIQSCSDLVERAPLGLKAGNDDALVG
jgi:hypothetical protein